MKHPLISIIMPCFNAEAFLPRSLASVQSQSFSNWELIAIDDGSTDGTLGYLRSQRDPRLKIISQSNSGVSAARNAGLEIAKGTYVAFLDADDSWRSDFLQKMHTALSADEDAVLAYCGWQNVGLPGDRGAPFIPTDYETPDKLERLFEGCRWPIHAALTHLEAIKKAGGFDTTLAIAEDFLLWLRIALTGRILRVPEVLAYYHFHGEAQATSKADQMALQLLRAKRIFLDDHPEITTQIGPAKIRTLTLRPLLQQGYECYWKRDLSSARRIFREVMKNGYGKLNDWKYMLPSLLPLTWHRWIIKKLSK